MFELVFSIFKIKHLLRFKYGKTFHPTFVKMLSLFTVLWASALEWNVEIVEVGLREKSMKTARWPRRRVLAGSSQAWLITKGHKEVIASQPCWEVLTVMDGPS